MVATFREVLPRAMGITCGRVWQAKTKNMQTADQKTNFSINNTTLTDNFVGY